MTTIATSLERCTLITLHERAPHTVPQADGRAGRPSCVSRLSACPQPSSHLRIARSSRDLDRAERFWVDGLGLEVLYRAETDAEGGHARLMLGWPQAAWHLELVENPREKTPPNSTDEDLLVLYVGGPTDEEAVDQLVRAGGQQVAARNPYWDRWGVTIVDPDGYRLVLSHRSWP